MAAELGRQGGAARTGPRLEEEASGSACSAGAPALEESSFKVMQVVGRIQFLAVVRLRSPFSSCFLARGHSQLQKAALKSFFKANRIIFLMHQISALRKGPVPCKGSPDWFRPTKDDLIGFTQIQMIKDLNYI